MQIHRTYQYRLYEKSTQNRHLHQMIRISGMIWNHAVALQRRYYRLFGKYIAPKRLKAHFSKLRMRTRKYAYWKSVNSQTVQDVLERLDRSYQKFFKKQGGLPRFKKTKNHKSFTLEQSVLQQKVDKAPATRKGKGDKGGSRLNAT